MSECYCGSGEDLGKCCQPFLSGDKFPATAEALMRSRYSAYVAEDYGYVVRTCHESTRPDESEFDDTSQVKWTGLEIVDTEAGGEEDDEGIVEFIARYRVSGGGTMGMHERASFVREDGRWYYLDGELVKSPPLKSAKIGRNEPCPCGSGRKYKKCCLKK